MHSDPGGRLSLPRGPESRHLAIFQFCIEAYRILGCSGTILMLF